MAKKTRAVGLDDAELWESLRLADLRSHDKEFSGYERSDRDANLARKTARWAKLRALERRTLDITWTAIEAARHALRSMRTSRAPQTRIRKLYAALTSKIRYHGNVGDSLGRDYYQELEHLRDNLASFLADLMYQVIERSHRPRSIRNTAATAIGLFLLSAVDIDVPLRPTAYSVARARKLLDGDTLTGDVRAFLREAISSASTFGERGGEQVLLAQAKRLLRRHRPPAPRRRARTIATPVKPAKPLPDVPKSVVEQSRDFVIASTNDGCLTVRLPELEQPKRLTCRNGTSRTLKAMATNKVGQAVLAIALEETSPSISLDTWKRVRRTIRQTCGLSLRLEGTPSRPRLTPQVYVLRSVYDFYKSPG